MIGSRISELEDFAVKESWRLQTLRPVEENPQVDFLRELFDWLYSTPAEFTIGVLSPALKPEHIAAYITELSTEKGNLEFLLTVIEQFSDSFGELQTLFVLTEMTKLWHQHQLAFRDTLSESLVNSFPKKKRVERKNNLSISQLSFMNNLTREIIAIYPDELQAQIKGVAATYYLLKYKKQERFHYKVGVEGKEIEGLRVYAIKCLETATRKINALNAQKKNLPETKAFVQLISGLNDMLCLSEAASFNGRNEFAVNFYINNFALIELTKKVRMIPGKLCNMRARLNVEQEEEVMREKIINDSEKLLEIRRNYNAYNSRVLRFFNTNVMNLAKIESECSDSYGKLESEKLIAFSVIDRMFRVERAGLSSPTKVNKGHLAGSSTRSSVVSESS